MSTVRSFAANDRVVTSLGNIELVGSAHSTVILVNLGSTGNFPWFLVWKDSSTVSQYFNIGNSGNVLSWNLNGETFSTSTYTSSRWYLFGVSRPGGAAQTVRFHIKDLTNNTVWVHENGGTKDDPAALSGGGTLSIGGGDGTKDIGLAAVWKSNLSDANYESMTSLAAISALNPNGYWILDQASTSTAVTDETGGGANESSLVGTTVNSSATIPNFTFERSTGVAPTIRTVASPLRW
jgi:hypothetical protein